MIGKAAPAAVTQVVRGRGSVLEQAPAGPATATPPPAARKPIGLWLGLAAVLLILLGGGGYFALAPRGPDPEAVKARAAAQQDQQHGREPEPQTLKTKPVAATRRFGVE